MFDMSLKRSPRPQPPAVGDRDLVATNLVQTYSGTDGVPALGGVSLTVTPGDSVAVMGPSGSGKTTLLHCLAGILTPTSGSVFWRGQDLTRLSDAKRTRLRRKDFGFVFQSGQLLGELPAVENVALPAMLGGMGRREATALARALLPELGLVGLDHRRPGELSGGQAQRVAIARALVGHPGIVFADEPTGALDQRTGADVMNQLLVQCRRHDAGLVVVTHDRDVAAKCARIVEMRDGVLTSADSWTRERVGA